MLTSYHVAEINTFEENEYTFLAKGRFRNGANGLAIKAGC